MNDPYQFDGFSAIYCQKIAESPKKRVLDADIGKSTIQTFKKPVVSALKKSKYNAICKRCKVYSFDKCDCIIRSLENVYITGKRAKFIL